MTGPLTADRVLPLLRGAFGRPYLYEPVCASTQDLLRDERLPEGAVAVADHQTAGRGRSGRTWEDVPGAALLCSVLLRPPASPALAQLSLACALATAEVVEAATGAAAGIKWPNDVLLGGRKVAGILLEGVAGAVVCGIGVNVNQPAASLPDGPRVAATSLLAETGTAHDRAEVLVRLLERLEARYREWRAGGLEPLLVDLAARDALRGQRVRDGACGGVAAGIAPDGRLVVRRDDGTTALVSSGEVVLELSGERAGHTTAQPPASAPKNATRSPSTSG